MARERRKLEMRLKAVTGIMVTSLLIGMLTSVFVIQPVKADLPLQLETDKDIYFLGENITIILTNLSDETITMGGCPPYRIYRYPEEEVVYPKHMVTLMWDFDPGRHTYTWNQYNEITEDFVEPGMYLARLGELTAFFEIVARDALFRITADGAVEPSTAPIRRDGDLYTLTSNLYDSIVVERSNIVIDGNGYVVKGNGSARKRGGFTLDGVSNVTIKNSRINGFTYGIDIISASNITVYGNKITNNYDGIVLSRFSNRNIISGNRVEDNKLHGVRLHWSFNNTIWKNILTQNMDSGIRLYSSSNNSIAGNNITASNRDAIEFHKSSTNTICGNKITENHMAVYFSGSSNNTISGNNITNNYCGLWLTEYTERNASGVINVYSSNYNSILENNITNNEYGITLLARANFICHNNFVKNKNQIDTRQRSRNEWDNGVEGNYWYDYSGEDDNGDGIGDTPYTIDEENQDRYPLMSPWAPSENELRPQTDLTVFYALAIATIATIIATAFIVTRKKKKLLEEVAPLARAKITPIIIYFLYSATELSSFFFFR